MRIRKLLGCASELGTAPSPQTPGVAAVPAAAAEVMENANEDGEEGMSGAVKYGFKTGEKKEDGVEEGAKDKDEKGQASRRWRREIISEEAHAVTKCKKTDGKGWHCKRAAQHPQSLCSYHLAQLRSYRTRFEDRVSGGRGNRGKKSVAAMEAGGGASNCRYYYSILSPGWGKRKASADDKAGHGALADNGGCEVDGDGGRCSGSFSCSERRVEKKRGRKPVKARSLKSLL